MRTMRDLLGQVLVLVVIVFLFTLRVARVSGVSMEPTLPPDAVVIISTLDYRIHPPHRGDVIAFEHDRMGPAMFVKRVIGLPGEAVSMHDGRAYVGQRNVDPETGRMFDHRSLPPLTVGEAHYYVLGDDRPRSDDSRSWGTVPANAVSGRAVAVVWPLDRLSLLR